MGKQLALKSVRVLLPIAIAVAGIVLLVLGGEVNVSIGITLIGVAFVVVLANVFVRLSLDSERDRTREESRRASSRQDR